MNDAQIKVFNKNGFEIFTTILYPSAMYSIWRIAFVGLVYRLAGELQIIPLN